MSSRVVSKVPELIEPFRFAEQGLSITGGIPLTRMPRLSESLLEENDEVAVDLEFGRDEQGRSRLWGRVDALLSVQCQRCLDAMQLPLSLNVNLLLAHSEDQAERIGPGEDALIVDEELVSLPGLIEDELMLAMPIIPKHPQGGCQVEWKNDPEVSVAAENPRENPFSVLEELKKDK